ncbi:MAG: DUF2203 family protein, partial [bacterium]
IPFVREIFDKAHRLILEATSKRTPSTNGNGRGRRAADPANQIESANALLSELTDRGIVLQDANRGLIDFPHLRDGKEEVFLCYELTDGDRIVAWHELYAGYAGRKPIGEL